MSGRVSKSRGATASLEAATTTLNERILKVSGGGEVDSFILMMM